MWAYRPRIQRTKSSWTISTSTAWAAATLFTRLRHAVIDFETCTITLSTWRLFLFSHIERLVFDDVSHLDYAYGVDVPTWGWIPSVVTAWLSSGFLGAIFLPERFSVGVVTRDGTVHPVCAFRGEVAAWTAPVIDQGGFSARTCGSHEAESRQFATELAAALGVPMSKPLSGWPAVDEAFPELLAMAGCPACGHRISPVASECLYCGESVKSRAR